MSKPDTEIDELRRIMERELVVISSDPEAFIVGFNDTAKAIANHYARQEAEQEKLLTEEG